MSLSSVSHLQMWVKVSILSPKAIGLKSEGIASASTMHGIKSRHRCSLCLSLLSPWDASKSLPSKRGHGSVCETLHTCPSATLLRATALTATNLCLQPTLHICPHASSLRTAPSMWQDPSFKFTQEWPYRFLKRACKHRSSFIQFYNLRRKVT
jgi:hypothetical protein